MVLVRLFVLSDLLPLAILLNNWTVISLPSWQAKNYCQSIRQLQGTSDSDICRFVASVRSVTAKKNIYFHIISGFSLQIFKNGSYLFNRDIMFYVRFKIVCSS